MAKINRFNGNLQAPASAALGTERTIFGAETQSNELTDQFTAELLRGWGIIGPSDEPTLQDFNAMGFTLGQLHAYLHQVGVAEYNALQEYHVGSFTNRGGVLYVSLVNNNVGNTPESSPLKWFNPSKTGIVLFATPGVTNWTVPDEMKSGAVKPFVQVVGGGGGGGGAAATTAGQLSAAGGGAAGGYSQEYVDLTGVDFVNVTVGTAGASGVGGVSNGGLGGTTSFGPYLSATGGNGGFNQAPGTSASFGVGGTLPGVGANGDINSRGASGLPGLRLTGNDGHSGAGGDSFFSGGGSPVYSQVGGNGGALGSGGSGALSLNGGAAGNGGLGGSGLVVIQW